jgi:hypothetical protein
MNRFIFYQQLNIINNKDHNNKKLLIFNATFMDSLMKFDLSLQITNVLSSKEESIFDYEQIIVVSHDERNHWFFYVIKPQNNHIIIYDSFSSNRNNVASDILLLKYLINEEELISRKRTKHHQWTIIRNKEMPIQRYPNESGMYVMIGINSLVHNLPLRNFSSEEMKMFRYKIIHFFLNNNDVNNNNTITRNLSDIINIDKELIVINLITSDDDDN